MDTVAPLVGQMFLGMNDPVVNPRLTPGMSPFDAFYSQRVTGPQWEETQQQVLTGLGQGLGEDLGRVGSNFGINRLFDKSSTEFNSMLADMGADTGGQLLAGMLTQSPVAQEIMGGDVMGMFQELFSNRQALGDIPGMPTNPMDSLGQERSRAHMMAFGGELSKAIRGTENGGIGILKNDDFTRGFRDEEIGQIATTMTERGSPVMRGADIDPREKVAEVGKMTRTLEALGDLIGSDDLNKLFGSLDKLTRQQWPDMNPQQLETSFRNMKASADILGVSADQMISTTESMQGLVKGAIAPGLGQTGGGYTQLPATQLMAENVMAIAHTTGKTTPQDIQRIQQQQGGLMAIGMQSSQGRDIQAIEFLKERGLVNDAEYDDFQSSLQGGSKANQKTMAQRILERGFGSDAEGGRITDDPAMMAFIRENTGGEAALSAAGSIMTAQQTEFGERVRDRVTGDLSRRTTDMTRSAGRRHKLDRGAEADLRMDVISDFFTEQGTPEIAEALQETFQKELKTLQPQVDSGNMTAGQAKQQAMMSVNQNLRQQTDPSTIRDLNKLQKEAVTRASAASLLTPEAQAEAATTTALKTITSLAGVDESIRDRAFDIRNMEDPAERAEALAKLQNDGVDRGDGSTARFTVNQLGTIERRVQKEQTGFESQQRQAKAEDTVLQRTEAGRAFGMSDREIAAESQDLEMLFTNVLTSGVEQQDRIDAINKMTGLSDKDRKKFIVAAESGDMDDLKKAATSHVQGMRTVSDEDRDRSVKAIKDYDPSKTVEDSASDAGLDDLMDEVLAQRVTVDEAKERAGELSISDSLKERTMTALDRIVPGEDARAGLNDVGAEQAALGDTLNQLAAGDISADDASKRIKGMDKLSEKQRNQAITVATSGDQDKIRGLAAQETEASQIIGSVVSGERSVKSASAVLNAESEDEDMNVDRTGVNEALESYRASKEDKPVARTIQSMIGAEGTPDELREALSGVTEGGDIDTALTTVRDMEGLDDTQRKQAVASIHRYELDQIGQAGPGKNQDLETIAQEQKSVNMQLATSKAGIENLPFGYGGAVQDQTDARRLTHGARMAAPGLAMYQTAIADRNQGLRATLPQLAVGFLQGRTSMGRMLGLTDADPGMKSPQSKLAFTLNQAAGGQMSQGEAARAVKGIKGLDDEQRETAISTIQGGDTSAMSDLATEQALEGSIDDEDLRDRVEDFQDTKTGKRMQAGVEMVAAGQSKFESAWDDLTDLGKDEDIRNSGGNRMTENALRSVQRQISKGKKALTPEQQKKEREKLEERLATAGVSSGDRDKLVEVFDKGMDSFTMTEKGQGEIIAAGEDAQGDEKTKQLMTDVSLHGRMKQRKAEKEDTERKATRARQQEVFRKVGDDKTGGAFATEIDVESLAGDQRKKLISALKVLEEEEIGDKGPAGKLRGDRGDKNLRAHVKEAAGDLEAGTTLSEKGRAAKAAMGEVYLQQQQEQEAEARASGGGGGSSQGGQTLELSGQMLLKGERGNVIGTIDASGTSGTLIDRR